VTTSRFGLVAVETHIGFFDVMSEPK
jgi:hypothetical protein